MKKDIPLIREFSGVSLFGELVCWSCNGVKVTYHTVIQALRDSGLDENVARKLLPRNAFKRACKSLSSNRVIREVKELSSATELVFQFTAEKMGEGRFSYELEALVKINRDSGRVDCENADLKDRAQSLLDEAIEGRTGNDVTRIIQRLFEQNADLFPVRDRGGIYFVPIAFREFVDKIQTFMGKMNATLDRWPVPSGMAESKASVRDSITAGLDRAIEEHFAAIEQFDDTTRASTFANHERNIQETQFRLEAYQALLEDRKEALEKSLEKARELLQARMAGMFSAFNEDESRPPQELVDKIWENEEGVAPAKRPVPPVDNPVDDEVWESDDRYHLPEESEMVDDPFDWIS